MRKEDVLSGNVKIDSTVRYNLMNEFGSVMPRTRFNGKQFVCQHCKWESAFEEEFIQAFKDKWLIDKVNVSNITPYKQ